MCVGRKALFSNTTIIPDTTFIRDSRVLQLSTLALPAVKNDKYD